MTAADLTTATWRKSSRSNGEGNQCVEIAALRGGSAAIRDSKAPEDGVLRVSARAWTAFRTAAQRDS